MRSGLRRAPLRPPRAETPQAFRRPVALLHRGGRLIAHSLAERPPPALALSYAPGPSWLDVSTKEGKKDKVELHGETLTRGVSELMYTAKQPLPPDRLDPFAISLKLPAGEEGESVRPRPSAVMTMVRRCGWRSPRSPLVRASCWSGSARGWPAVAAPPKASHRDRLSGFGVHV